MESIVQTIAKNEIAVTLKGQATDRRQHVHLIFLVDVSDSMNDGRKIQTVKQSLEFLVPLLTPEDLVSLITFGEESEVLLNKATDRDAILYKIRGLKTDGCTNLSAGLMNIRQVLLPPTDAKKQGVLILTDGHANRGLSSAEGLKNIVQSLLTESPSLTLTTVGYGHDHNTELLKDVATNGAGSYNVVYNLENVAMTFGEVLGGLTTVVAQNVAVYLPPGSKPKTAYAVNDQQDGSIQVRVGDVYSENEIVILASVPEGTSHVRIAHHDMIALTSQDSLSSVREQEDPIPKSIQMADYRYRVSNILRTGIHDHSDESKATVESILAQLKGLPYVEDQLVQMMIDDLEHLLQVITAPTTGGFGGGLGGAALAATSSGFAQHSAYLGLGRGLRSQIPEAHAEYESDDENPVAPPLSQTRTARVDPFSTPFANRAQRRVTTHLRATSSQAAAPSSPVLASAPLSATSSAPI